MGIYSQKKILYAAVGFFIEVVLTLAFSVYLESKSNFLSHSSALGTPECESELDFHSKNRRNARVSWSLMIVQPDLVELIEWGHAVDCNIAPDQILDLVMGHASPWQ